MEKLKKCPFCGEKPSITPGGSNPFWVVIRCKNCEVKRKFEYYYSVNEEEKEDGYYNKVKKEYWNKYREPLKEKAILWWNTRYEG